MYILDIPIGENAHAYLFKNNAVKNSFNNDHFI